MRFYIYFYNLINKLSKEEKIIIYVDMDGVIASYDFGKPLDFANKRPLITNIKTLEKVSHLKNVELHILSVCRKKREIKDKNDWLDKVEEENLIFSLEGKHLGLVNDKLHCTFKYHPTEKEIFNNLAGEYFDVYLIGYGNDGKIVFLR